MNTFNLRDLKNSTRDSLLRALATANIQQVQVQEIDNGYYYGIDLHIKVEYINKENNYVNVLLIENNTNRNLSKYNYDLRYLVLLDDNVKNSWIGNPTTVSGNWI